MSFTMPSRSRSGPRRRSLLAGIAGAGAVLLTGCSGDESPDGGPGRPSAVVRARARAARDSVALAERYDAVLASHPGLADRLAPLRAEVERHAEAFGHEEPKRAEPEKSASPGSVEAAAASSSPSSAPSAASVPADPKKALSWLAAAERETADRRVTQSLDLPGEDARLLASVAAAGAAHAYVLTEGDK
ncbi:hypothetical protein ACIQNU_26450 [Streptomyces sp. NPDC091292]|uniref:hypothetical protein n=1 Tax=Streptomyces sp. NPDC091292 TaxID=3365991 RepID=UPI00380E19D7